MSISAKLNVQVAFKSLDSSDAVKDYAEKRASKFTKHLHSITNCHYVFQTDKQGFLAHIHLTSGDFEARAEAHGETLYAAIDEVAEKILHQTRKFKEKQTDHSGIPHHNGVADVANDNANNGIGDDN